MKRTLKNLCLALCLGALSVSCNRNEYIEPRAYHYSIIAGEEKLTTRYLHENITLQLNDIGENAYLRKLKNGDVLDFQFPKNLLLSYHPKAGYILEIEQKDQENNYFILGSQNFTVTIKNRNTGKLNVGTPSNITNLPPTQKLINSKEQKYINYYMPEAITEMIIENYKSRLSLCWQDNSGHKIVYHCTFAKDNFVIESGGDLLTTCISYEQKERFEYNRKEGYYYGWRQYDIFFRGYYYENNQIKEYKKAPQIRR